MRKINLLYFLAQHIINMDPSSSESESLHIDFQEHFHLPIYYNSKKRQLNTQVQNDLELTKTISSETDKSSNTTSIYNYFLNNQNTFSHQVMEKIANYYTTDVDFLKDTQQLLKTYQPLIELECNNDESKNSTKYTKIQELWKEVKMEDGFKEKYYYIDWPMWEFLNHSEPFLQFMSIYNMASPVISLFIPIIILIIPFFVIKIKGLDLSIQEYIEVLKIIVSQHALGKLFTDFNDVPFNEKMYLLVSAGFYLFSIYQNILVCIRFNNNMIRIHSYLKDLTNYLDASIESMNHYIIHANPLKTYKEFNQVLIEKVAILQDLKKKLSIISEYKLSFFKVTEIGYVLKQFYEIHSNKVFEDALLYSFGFNGYIDCLHGIKKNLVEKKIHFVSFTKNKKKNTFKGNYYAALKERNPVKNTVKMNKNMILTGPNASGKTTVLKATLINVILSQQFGCGFYDSGSLLKPYDHLHCYLNIPDTSGRDSLFQAEARRCKEIITSIQETKTESHFCVFDELYSGTNPEEAAVSAISFMNYLVKHKHVSTLLTTHYYNVCETLEKNKKIVNYHMKVDDSSNKNMENIGNFRYTYLLSKGISKVRGGIKVLKDMDYPEEIIESLRNN